VFRGFAGGEKYLLDQVRKRARDTRRPFAFAVGVIDQLLNVKIEKELTMNEKRSVSASEFGLDPRHADVLVRAFVKKNVGNLDPAITSLDSGDQAGLKPGEEPALARRAPDVLMDRQEPPRAQQRVETIKNRLDVRHMMEGVLGHDDVESRGPEGRLGRIGADMVKVGAGIEGMTAGEVEGDAAGIDPDDAEAAA
jgi:hypothetical protein